MDFMRQVLRDHSNDFARVLSEQAGFTEDEARRFLDGAGPALVRSYEWQASGLPLGELPTSTIVRELLAGIPGRTLGSLLGIPAAKTWAGLRTLVPAVVRAHDRAAGRRHPTASERIGSRRNGTTDAPDDAPEYPIGFGLSVDRRGYRRRNGSAPTRWLRSLPDSPARPSFRRPPLPD
jgi:hypothetical protein